ncbi:MAG: hypothetical protein NTX55_00210 [Candidatus Parcubacteria bacterium]|nr:hypothetical protein [Candidatus Parcubacteria bacterium]
MRVKEGLTAKDVTQKGITRYEEERVEKVLSVLREMPVELRISDEWNEWGKPIEIVKIETNSGAHPRGLVPMMCCWVDLNYRREIERGFPCLVPDQIFRQIFKPKENIKEELPIFVLAESKVGETVVIIQYSPESGGTYWFSIHF